MHISLSLSLCVRVRVRLSRLSEYYTIMHNVHCPLSPLTTSSRSPPSTPPRAPHSTGVPMSSAHSSGFFSMHSFIISRQPASSTHTTSIPA